MNSNQQFGNLDNLMLKAEAAQVDCSKNLVITTPNEFLNLDPEEISSNTNYILRETNDDYDAIFSLYYRNIFDKLKLKGVYFTIKLEIVPNFTGVSVDGFNPIFYITTF